jgi:hypothetical protein
MDCSEYIILNIFNINRSAYFTIIVLFISALPASALGFGSGLVICESILEPKMLVNPVVITDCTETALRSALDNGGHITFDCGPNPVSIPISTTLLLSPTEDTVLDGAGLVTLDGQNSSRLFFKDWHTGYDVTITLQNIRMINAKAPSGDMHSGGVFYGGHPGTRVHVINSTFENNSTSAVNTADNQGGVLFVHNSYETIISGSEFINNQAGNGGAIGGIATGLLVFNSRFVGNEAIDASSGGIVKGHGGAIHLDGVTNTYNPDSHKRVHVCGSVFENNTSVRGGGALKVTVSDNKGIKATYEKSSFFNNSSSGSSGIEGHGGAIYHIEDDHAGGSNELNVELIECLFSSNHGWRQGGGAWFSVLGNSEIINNTFVDNDTRSTDLGMGGALCLSYGTSNVVNNTFARNYAWFHGGGIQAGGGANVTLKNNLFYFNESVREWACYQMNRAADIDGGGNLQYPQKRFNQSGDRDDCTVTSEVIIADPLLESLADNGGPNWTMALPAASPAVGSGTNSGAPGIDQRGYDRDAFCDIGAYEFNRLSEINLTDVILTLQVCVGSHDVDMSSLQVIDINDDQVIGIAEAIYALQVIVNNGTEIH